MTHSHIAPIVPSASDSLLAKSARLTLKRNSAANGDLRVQIAAPGQEASVFELPAVVNRLLLDLLEETAAGNAVALASVAAEVTTQQAADILNVSRPFLIGLIDKGALSARKVGRHRRLPLAELLAYKADNAAKRRKALDELVALDQDLGLI